VEAAEEWVGGLGVPGINGEEDGVVSWRFLIEEALIPDVGCTK
jgi:hypothetical protein